MHRAAIAIGLVVARIADAAPVDPEIASLGRALPAGWQLEVANTELTIRRPAPVRVAGRYLDGPHYANLAILAADASPEIIVALRYRIEPKWSATKLERARADNAKIYAALKGLRADDPEYVRWVGQLVQLPSCTLGGTSVFDRADTYAQLDLVVDPPWTMREAYAIVELVKRRCR